MSIFGEEAGKFVVLEGTDGSGKTTQLNRLLEYAKANNIPTHTLDFPQYEDFWGKTVGRFLNGDFGDFDNINPYLVQPLYMLDQATQGNAIRDALERKEIVLSNRYLTSSMAHQTAKFVDPKEKAQFLEWVQEAGYKQLNMPKPDLVVVLFVPPEISSRLAKKATGRKSKYTKADIAENHQLHQRKSAQMYQELCRIYPEWILVQCVDEEGNLLDIETIHALVKEQISSFFSRN